MMLEQKQKNPRPELPELYRTLSELIENPREFFDSLIQMETRNNNLTVRAWHIPDPVISLRDIPNPISQTGTDNFPETLEENQPAYPMELCLTPINPKTIGPGEIKTEEILAENFEAALIHRTKEILGHSLSQQWEEPEGIKDLLTAGKCVFYASDISETLEAYIENLDCRLQEEMEKKFNPQVIGLLDQSAPPRGFKPSREEMSDETPDDPRMSETGIMIGQYNKAALILGCSKETRSANAGAVPFILAQKTPNQEVSHQGEFIGSERARAMQHGMTAHGWKRMTHMDPKLTHSVILFSKDLEEAAGIINWLAHQGQNIQERSLSQMMQHADIREKLSRPPEEPGRPEHGKSRRTGHHTRREPRPECPTGTGDKAPGRGRGRLRPEDDTRWDEGNRGHLGRNAEGRPPVARTDEPGTNPAAVDRHREQQRRRDQEMGTGPGPVQAPGRDGGRAHG